MEKYPDEGQLASGLPYGSGMRKASAVGFGGAAAVGAAALYAQIFPFGAALF